MKCEVAECQRLARGHGRWCNLHRQRVRKHGDPNAARWPATADRFWNRVAVTENGCWLWLGSLTGRRSYGQFWYDGKNGLAHRFIYEQTIGSIPVELELDHVCREKRCVNPTHLEVVTPQENIRRREIAAGRV